jgi:hypothetical protein
MNLYKGKLESEFGEMKIQNVENTKRLMADLLFLKIANKKQFTI